MPTDIRSEDRPRPGRHRMPDTEPAQEQHVPPRWEPAPAAPPPWPAEPSRLLTRQVGEGPTVRIKPRRGGSQALPMPLPSRAKGAALEAETKPLPKWDLLGRCLHAIARRRSR